MMHFDVSVKTTHRLHRPVYEPVLLLAMKYITLLGYSRTTLNVVLSAGVVTLVKQ